MLKYSCPRIPTIRNCQMLLLQGSIPWCTAAMMMWIHNGQCCYGCFLRQLHSQGWWWLLQVCSVFTDKSDVYYVKKFPINSQSTYISNEGCEQNFFSTKEQKKKYTVFSYWAENNKLCTIHKRQWKTTMKKIYLTNIAMYKILLQAAWRKNYTMY